MRETIRIALMQHQKSFNSQNLARLVLTAQAKLERRIAIRRKALLRKIDLIGIALRNGDMVSANNHEESAMALLNAFANDLQKIEQLKAIKSSTTPELSLNLQI